MNTNKRVSSIGDKLINIKANISKLTMLDDEKNYLNKLETTESNITSILEHKKKLIAIENEKIKRKNDIVTKNIQQYHKENNHLREKIFKLDKQYEELQVEFNKFNEIKKKYFNDILKIRKENTKDLDNKILSLAKQEKQIKKLQNELFLLLNILKLRIINIDTAESQNIYKGYIINIHDNTLIYVEIDKKEDPHSCALKYWRAMKELLIDKN
jgi:hypothetical protein